MENFVDSEMNKFQRGKWPMEGNKEDSIQRFIQQETIEKFVYFLVFLASYKLVYHSISFFKDHFNKGRFLIEENFFLDQNLCIKKSKEIATLNIAISLTSTRYLMFKQTRKEEGKKKDTIFDAIMRFLQAIP